MQEATKEVKKYLARLVNFSYLHTDEVVKTMKYI